MAKKDYSWIDGAILEEHSARKHKVVREYFARYLAVRCQRPQQSRFRMAIVDGFAGGGRYKCGSPGSPIIFLEELKRAAEEFNLRRAAEGMAPLDIECLLVLNDSDPDTLALLKSNLAPLQAEITQNVPRLHLQVAWYSDKFEVVFPQIQNLLNSGGFKNVLFNLDQCGSSMVSINTIRNIIASFVSAEVFYTFAIQSLITFLNRTDKGALSRQLAPFGITAVDLKNLDGLMNTNEWLGAAERMVFNAFRGSAGFTSPFSIHNDHGWRYWLIHFANNVRARQEYNNILHQNSSAQAHFGRSGLNMLSYKPSEAGSMLYVFDGAGRVEAKKQLHDDIPRVITDYGDALPVGDFYSNIYNETPAHMLDINTVLIENPDLEVVTDNGSPRRKPNTIKTTDILRIKNQRSLFPMFDINKLKK